MNERLTNNFFRADRFGPLHLEGVSFRFPVVAGNTLCRVDVTADPNEITHLDGKVYVRHGCQTLELTGAALTHWIRRRGEGRAV